jgi:hypothetical protein
MRRRLYRQLPTTTEHRNPQNRNQHPWTDFRRFWNQTARFSCLLLRTSLLLNLLLNLRPNNPR